MIEGPTLGQPAIGLFSGLFLINTRLLFIRTKFCDVVLITSPNSWEQTKIAFSEFEKQNDLKEKIFVVAGGVAANKRIRSMLINLCNQENYQSIFPPIEFCGDNAAMIAMVGLEKFKLKQFSNLDFPAKPRWPLDENAAFLKGAGVKL